MRVTLLEVIQRPVNEILPHLLPGAVVAQMVRGPATTVGVGGRQPVRLGGRAGVDVTHFAADFVEEYLLETSPQMK